MNIRQLIGGTLSKLYIKAEELVLINTLQKVFDYFTKSYAKFTGTVDFTDANVVGLSGGDSRPYKVYIALLTQSGTNAPSVTVLENTTKYEFTYAYLTPGVYNVIPSEEDLDSQKIWLNINLANDLNDVLTSTARLFVYDNTALRLHTFDNGVASDELLGNAAIEIRVYY